jgi:hypothetical protein
MWPYADTAAFDRYAYHNDFQCNYVGFRLTLPVPTEKLALKNEKTSIRLIELTRCS